MDNSIDNLSVLIILVSACGLFLSIWFGILFLISRFGGWNKLYKAYPFPQNPGKPILVKSFQSIQLGLSNYNGVMTLSYFPEGLGIKVMILFRFQHPDILIPWKDIRIKEISKSIFVWNQLEIGNPVVAKISVNNKVLKEIEKYISKIDSIDDKW